MKFVWFLCLMCSALAERSPTIVRITDNQARNIGSSVDLSCSVQFSHDYPVLWRKIDKERSGNDPIDVSHDSALLIGDSRFSLRYDKSSTTYTLQIRDIQISDAGFYRCDILLSPNTIISKEVELVVNSPPVIYDNSSSTIVVSEFNPVTLECYAGGTPRPLISWKRENGAILPTGGTVYRGNILKINSIKKDDRGTYYCIADNKVDDIVTRSIAVEVEFPPSVKADKQWVQQALNYDADLECRIEAFPTPTINWLKNGYTLPSNSTHFKLTPSISIGQYRDSILRVNKIDSTRFGTYVCIAVNKLGDGKAEVHLEEVDDPVCPPACGSGHYSSGVTLRPTIFIFLLSTVTILKLLH